MGTQGKQPQVDYFTLPREKKLETIPSVNTQTEEWGKTVSRSAFSMTRFPVFAVCFLALEWLSPFFSI